MGTCRNQAAFAVIGAGNWGRVHAKVYSTSKRARLAWICDKDIAKARQLARELGVERYTDDYHEVLCDPSVIGVSVAVPEQAHAEVAVACAEAGKHVLVEKPLAPTTLAATSIVDACSKHGVTMMTNFHLRWNSAFAEARRQVVSGEMGRPILSYFRLSNTTFVPRQMLSWADKSSVLWFLGCHAIDLVLWLFNDEVRRVYATSRMGVLSSRGINTPDFFTVTAEFAGGAVAQFEHAWILPESHPSVSDGKWEVLCEAGSLEVDITHNGALRVYKDKASIANLFGFHELHGKPTGSPCHSINHFIDCVLDSREPLVRPEDGVRATRIIEAALESAAKGEPVDLS